MKIFLAVFLYCLDFLVASPTGAKVCDRPLNVLLLGYMGTGKSSIINVLHGLLDLEDGDENAVAKTSYGGKSCTREVSAYSCSHNGISLRIIDTPGFEATKERNNAISSQILSEVPNLFRDGFDSFFLVVKMDRTSYPKLANIMNSLQSLINQEGYNHGFIVFTYADNVLKEETAENEVIEEFKVEMKNLAPSEFLVSVRYLFYRHNKLTYFVNNKREKLNDEKTREVFLENAYAAIYQKCIENNGRTFSNLAMKKAKENYESEQVIIEEYRKKRLELKRLYENLVATTGTLSADLNQTSIDAKKLAPSTFEIVNQNQKTQKQVLQDEKDFDEKTKEFAKKVRSFHFTRDQIDQAAKNVTTLNNACQLTFETYNNATKNFTNTYNSMTPVKISDIAYTSTNSKSFFNTVWESLMIGVLVTRKSALKALQGELNKAFIYYKDHFKVIAEEIKNSTIVMPKLNATNPTFSNYTSHIENLKKFNKTVSFEAAKIRNSTIEMAKVPYVRQYPNNTLLIRIAEHIDRFEESEASKPKINRESELLVTLHMYGQFEQRIPFTPAVESLPLYYVNLNETEREGEDLYHRNQLLRDCFSYICLV
ncbi:hypothetical protein ROZALSC1DRAFT_30673 [Rozella allomycis CSF55]|uniref:AIG1-type G domain-containing protein n=1 Tax=Rozella allomycis (strain CSF55) TaxID=988480 RepID=A0A075ARF7_ROZAC|nr:hypothetical protein O9G_005686 [Rozella allomycis CSF55]RKP17530.1 hypothetical protein ROZALSC1DRAFT_30673 [Rozella allomycis CSF55]|eukprot:EPZ32881.1 hypothetical protein O9G_005686 [Rozella allomycis CSF55]